MHNLGICIFTGCFKSIRQHGEGTQNSPQYGYGNPKTQEGLFEKFQFIVYPATPGREISSAKWQRTILPSEVSLSSGSDTAHSGFAKGHLG